MCSLEHLLIWCRIIWIDPLILFSVFWYLPLLFFLLSGKCYQLKTFIFILSSYFKFLRTFFCNLIFLSIALCFYFINVIISHLSEDTVILMYSSTLSLFFPLCVAFVLMIMLKCIPSNIWWSWLCSVYIVRSFS